MEQYLSRVTSCVGLFYGSDAIHLVERDSLTPNIHGKGTEMALLKKSPEERAEAEANKQKVQEEIRAQRAREASEKEQAAFRKSPTGRARAAYERGDQVFQCAIDVMSQEAVIVAMVGSNTTQTTVDPVAVLNSVCREGWDLITGSFVFVEEGQQSRDKFMSSGQNVAIKGTTVGYYLFRRAP
ncbi:MAG: hypothetical protein WKF47_04820 [Geodermatophilaceae bacterium]